MASHPYLQARGVDTILLLKVTPRAPKNEIGEALGKELKLKIAAPPVDSAANEELIRFLARLLDRPRGSIQITRGASSRHKVVLIAGISVAETAIRLDMAKAP